MKAIPTIYRGIEYRSRLEAKWAAFFRNIGWQTTYEPFDGNNYIPDFLIHTDEPFLVEVKPAVADEDYQEPWQKINNGLTNHWQGPVFIAGVTPLPSHFKMCEFYSTIAGAMSFRQNGICDDCCHAYFIKHDKVVFNQPDYDTIAPCPHWRRFWTYNNTEYPQWISDNGNIGLHYTDFGQCKTLNSNKAPGHIPWDLRADIEAIWAGACNDVKWRAS